MAIDAKQAVEIATKYYTTVSGERATITVEEVELDGGFWVITLGISDSYSIAFSGNAAKSYKQFRINAEKGEVMSMKIRKV